MTKQRTPRRHGKMKPCLHCGTEFYCQAAHDVGGTLPEKKYCSAVCAKEYRRSQKPALFWAKVDKSAGPDECWPYMGFRKWDGYGWVGRGEGGKLHYTTAHRYAWILTNGEPPAGLHLLHDCDNPPCCNPSHLRLGTHQDNMADRVAKGRTKMGILHPDRVRPARRQS